MSRQHYRRTKKRNILTRRKHPCPTIKWPRIKPYRNVRRLVMEPNEINGMSIKLLLCIIYKENRYSTSPPLVTYNDLLSNLPSIITKTTMNQLTELMNLCKSH